MSLAILCPGQGHQHPGMLDRLADEADADAVVADACNVLGIDLRIWLRDPQLIVENVIAQTLICVAQLATWRALRSRLPQPSSFAGYSVGELASYACAEALDTGDLCRLTGARAHAMDDAGRQRPGTMVAIGGLRRAEIDALCKARQAWPAIVLDDASFVVGGSNEDIDAVVAVAALRGAKIRRLRVGVASHTPLLHAAVGPFREALETSQLCAPIAPVIAGIDASLVTRRDDAIRLLSRQVAEAIEWSRCLQALYERGCRVFLELGPGAALTRMVRERFADVEARSVDDFRTVDGAIRWTDARLKSCTR